MRPNCVFIGSSVLLATAGCGSVGGATDAQLSQISALKSIWPSGKPDRSTGLLKMSGNLETGKPDPADAETPASAEARQPDQIFLDGLSKEIQACAATAEKYRSAYDKNRAWTVGIATVGIIAGSIVVPAMAAGSASAAWVAGVGGVAGAANAAQLTLNSQGMSATASGQVYTALTEKIRAQLDTLDTLQSGVDGTAFILRLRATCLFTPLPEVTDAPTIAARTEKAIAQEKAEIAELEKKAATLEYEAVKIRVDKEVQAQRLKELQGK